jgi:outer membrane biosynthesis protein TonB
MNLRFAHLFVLLIGSFSVHGQELSAMDYFNRASREYVKQDKLTALKTLDEALKHHPGDPRLLKLAEELLKQEQQQQQQEQQKQEQQQKKQEQEQQQKQEQDKGEQDPKKKEEEKQDPKDPKQGDQQEPQERKEEGKIAPQDARRILDALDRQEKDVQEKVRAQQRPARRVPIEKDW